MSREEVLAALAVLKAAFPHSFKGMKEADAYALVNLWCRQFEKDDASLVNAALEALISTRTAGYTPTIGEVKAQMQRLQIPNEPTENEAWALVAKACTNGIYGYEKEFKKLPEVVQQAVGRPEQLREWAMVDTETLQTVIASNFMRSYRAAAERRKEYAMLPESVRWLHAGQALRAGFDEGLKIEKGDKS
jgi:hypothetical protein